MDTSRDQAGETTQETTPPADSAPVSSDDAGEFKIEIRKLEVPVRPRGVLAE
jgi:hypothetical protein